MRVAGSVVLFCVMAAPAMAGGRDGEYDPCRNPGARRIAVVFTRESGLLGREGQCKGSVHPDKKTVCAGDVVQWSVINTCDVEEVADVRIVGLERVTEKCTAVRRLEIGGAREIRCRVRRGQRDVRQEYEVTGRIGKSRMIVDPELIVQGPD
jgi:hypothetical protein